MPDNKFIELSQKQVDRQIALFAKYHKDSIEFDIGISGFIGITLYHLFKEIGCAKCIMEATIEALRKLDYEGAIKMECSKNTTKN